MQRLRKHLAIAIDGGGIRGIIPARALAILEDHLGHSMHELCRLTAGTSTGAVLAAGIARGLDGATMHQLYCDLGTRIFAESWRTKLWPLTRYRYPYRPLLNELLAYLGNPSMGDLWTANPQTDLVLTSFDLLTNHTCFIKPWKEEFRDWPLVYAVLASCSVPTYFPPVDGRYVDGGVGSYSNPCYLAAYELLFCLKWDPAETTLISLGTGRSPRVYQPGQANRLWPWDWLSPVLGAFLQSADDQQVHLVHTFFEKLDFRRFQVDLNEPIEMDDCTAIPLLVQYGEELGRKILHDELDRVLQWTVQCACP